MGNKRNWLKFCCCCDGKLEVLYLKPIIIFFLIPGFPCTIVLSILVCPFCLQYMRTSREQASYIFNILLIKDFRDAVSFQDALFRTVLFPPPADGYPLHGAGGGRSSGQGPATAPPPAAAAVRTAAEAAESAVPLQPLPEQTGYCGVS
jgi:hypothetical protein